MYVTTICVSLLSLFQIFVWLSRSYSTILLYIVRTEFSIPLKVRSNMCIVYNFSYCCTIFKFILKCLCIRYRFILYTRKLHSTISYVQSSNPKAYLQWSSLKLLNTPDTKCVQTSFRIIKSPCSSPNPQLALAVGHTTTIVCVKASLQAIWWSFQRWMADTCYPLQTLISNSFNFSDKLKKSLRIRTCWYIKKNWTLQNNT